MAAEQPTALIAVVALLTMLSGSARAQLVSVRCCTVQADLEKIGDCVSGPGDTDRPSSCAAGSTCVLGFGSDTGTMERLCDPARIVTAEPLRGYCDGWTDENAPILHECVARSGLGITLFEGVDDDQDGDLDLQDLTRFSEAYTATPKRIQSDARLVSVECCVPESVIRDIGSCLSGPGIDAHNAPCKHSLRCVAGFSEPIELGDYLYGNCAAGLAVTPDLTSGFCTRSYDPATPPVFECVAMTIPGNSLFVVSDDDGDGDVDFFDFAVFQRNFELP